MKWSREADPESYAVIGAAMEVHNHMGPALLELAYKRALSMELDDRGIPHELEAQLPLSFKGRDLGVTWRVDLRCFGTLLVELKSVPTLGRQERAQLRHYVASAGLDRGLLLNFGYDSLQFERVTKSGARPIILDIPESQVSLEQPQA